MWCRLAAAALIQPVAWEPPYVMGEALKYDDDDDDDKADVSKHESCDAGSSDTPKRSRNALPLSEKVKVLNLIRLPISVVKNG